MTKSIFRNIKLLILCKTNDLHTNHRLLSEIKSRRITTTVRSEFISKLPFCFEHHWQIYFIMRLQWGRESRVICLKVIKNVYFLGGMISNAYWCMQTMCQWSKDLVVSLPFLLKNRTHDITRDGGSAYKMSNNSYQSLLSSGCWKIIWTYERTEVELIGKGHKLVYNHQYNYLIWPWFIFFALSILRIVLRTTTLKLKERKYIM